MKKLISIIILSFMLTGCSLIPRLTFDSKGTTPQSIDKSRAKEVCKGKAVFNEHGDIVSCSRGYYAKSQNYEKKERKFTLIEKVGNFIRNLSGLGFWGLVLIVILCPSLIGSVLTLIFSTSRKVAEETIRAIKKFRREQTPEMKESLDNYLRKEQSKETKKYIAQERIEILNLCIQHII